MELKQWDSSVINCLYNKKARTKLMKLSIENSKNFRPREKFSVWIFKLENDYKRKTSFTGHSFNADWLEIKNDGTIIIPKGYAWNGCSPKFSFFDLAVIGTPDGIIDIESMKPKTYYASMVHDALYQYYSYHKITRKNIDKLFLEMMKEKSFTLSWVYYFAVRLFAWVTIRPKRV